MTLTPDASLPGTAPTVVTPVLAGDFAGFNSTESGYAWPDPTIAAGMDHVLIAVNSVLGVYGKDGVQQYAVELSDWFANVTPPGTPFNPKLFYDLSMGRWVMAALAGGMSNSAYLISVSETSDPLGDWWNWCLDAGLDGFVASGYWADYLGLGYDSGEAVYLTSNQYDSDGHFRYAKLRILYKKQLCWKGVAGPLNWWDLWDYKDQDGTPVFSWQAAAAQSSLSGTYLIDTKWDQGDSVTIWRLTEPLATGPKLVRQATVTIGTYSVPPNAVQPGGFDLIDTGDCRTRAVQYNTGTLITAFPEEWDWGSGPVSAVRALVIDASSKALDLDATYGGDLYHYYCPALISSGTGNLALVFNRSSSDEYVTCRFTALLAGDSQFQPSMPLKSGEDYYSQVIDGRNYWGQCSAAAVDSADPARVWIYGEYAASGNTWGTHVGQLDLPGPPVVTRFAIEDGAGSTIRRSVVLNNQCVGSPTHYLASELLDFSDATWQLYSTTPAFSLSPGSGIKTVYLRVKNADGESKTVSDWIEYLAPPSAGSVQFKSATAWILENGGSIRIYVSRQLASGQGAGSALPPQQSTTGPTPPLSAGVKSAVRPNLSSTAQLISGVPGYRWRHGCGPTAVGMVVGYYATHGYPDLISGDASVQTDSVDQAIASQGSGIRGTGYQQHYEDYSLPLDVGWWPPLPDSSVTYPVGCHPNNCIADFMQTSWSSVGNVYGWSWSSRAAPAFIYYVRLRNPTYQPQSVEYGMDENLWSTTVAEINSNHPMTFLVDSNGDGATDHFVTVVGYDSGSPRQYACLDTWDPPTQVRWCLFRPMSSSYAWGVWGGWTYRVNEAVSGPASVDYATADGSAVAGKDYQPSSGTLYWADGDTADKYFDIEILDDQRCEPDGAFNVLLSAATGATLGIPSIATVTIGDNDPQNQIERNPSNLSPSCVQGQDAASQSFELWSSGGGVVNYGISVDQPWLSCSTTTGTTSGEHDLITVTYRTAGFTSGVYNANIMLQDFLLCAGPQAIPVVLTVSPLDTDGDGIPDDVELLYGLDPSDPADGSIDSDADGLSNLEEYLAGTDPTDPNDTLAVSLIEPTGSDLRLSFRTITGKTYQLEQSDSSPGGPWIPVGDPIAGDGGVKQAIDVGADSSTRKYYRVLLVQ